MLSAAARIWCAEQREWLFAAFAMVGRLSRRVSDDEAVTRIARIGRRSPDQSLLLSLSLGARKSFGLIPCCRHRR
jgi:hypothetical protein